MSWCICQADSFKVGEEILKNFPHHSLESPLSLSEDDRAPVGQYSGNRGNTEARHRLLMRGYPREAQAADRPDFAHHAHKM